MHGCSPQTTVVEALLFSAELRFDKGVEKAVIHHFVEEVMELVELHPLRDALVSHRSSLVDSLHACVLLVAGHGSCLPPQLVCLASQ